MQRRKFLGLLGGSVVAGPKIVTEAAKAADLGSIDIRGVGTMAQAVSNATGPVSEDWGAPLSMTPEHAGKKLAKLMAESVFNRDREKREFNIYSLDANLASLRSVSLVRKIEISRDKQFEASREKKISYLKRVIAGLES